VRLTTLKSSSAVCLDILGVSNSRSPKGQLKILYYIYIYNGYRVFPGGKLRPGSAADHSPPSSAADMEE